MKNVCHWRDHNNTQIGIGIGVGDNVNATAHVLDTSKRDDTPTFAVEVNKDGKFKRLKPRKIK